MGTQKGFRILEETYVGVDEWVGGGFSHDGGVLDKEHAGDIDEAFRINIDTAEQSDIGALENGEGRVGTTDDGEVS